MSIPGNERRITQAWANVRRRMRVFATYFTHLSEGWRLRNEALMETMVKQVRTTRRPWLIACVVSRRFQEEPLFTADTCSSRRQEKVFQPGDPKAHVASLLRERTSTLSPVTACKERSRKHKAVTFLVDGDKEFEVWHEEQCPSFAKIQWWRAMKQSGRRKRRGRKRRGRKSKD